MSAVDTPLGARDIVGDHLSRGLQLVFYPTRSKGPSGPDAHDWQNRPSRSLHDYRDGDNVGALLGTEIAPGSFLVDADFDWSEGLSLFGRDLLLPSTYVIGRQSKRISHAFFTTSTPVRSEAYEDIDGTMLVELRGTKADGSIGLQTMLPPSIHPNGEVIEFRTRGPIPHDDRAPRCVLLYAIACILYRNVGRDRWLKHHVRLALAGFLLRAGLKEDEVLRLGQSLCRATGNDERDMDAAVQTTARKLGGQTSVTGAKSFAEALSSDKHDKTRVLNLVRRIRSWLGDEFATSRDDKIIVSDLGNIRTALKKAGVTLSYNDFLRRAQIALPGKGPRYEDDDAYADMLDTLAPILGGLPQDRALNTVVSVDARRNAFHPVLQYLDGVTWDGVPRIDGWLANYAAADDNPYVRAISAIVLIAAVRRVRHAGCKYDEMLVLESEQGWNKSSALRMLAVKDEWFTDDLPLHRDAKLIIEGTLGKWIVEAAELSGMHRAKVEHLKAMLSRQVDGPARLAWERKPMERQRQFIFIGTTNSSKYLKDQTGNRRFWPVRVNRFNLDALKADREQLWAEAAAREGKGESIRLDPSLWALAEEQQKQRRLDDPWVDILEEYGSYEDRDVRVTYEEIFAKLGVSGEVVDGQKERAASIMERMGFTYVKKTRSVSEKNVNDGKAFGRVDDGIRGRWCRGPQTARRESDGEDIPF